MKIKESFAELNKASLIVFEEPLARPSRVNLMILAWNFAHTKMTLLNNVHHRVQVSKCPSFPKCSSAWVPVWLKSPSPLLVSQVSMQFQGTEKRINIFLYINKSIRFSDRKLSSILRHSSFFRSLWT